MLVLTSCLDFNESHYRFTLEPDAGPVVPSSCDGKVCRTPPRSTCTLDGGSLNIATPVGLCTADVRCAYGIHEERCANGCAEGACIGDPCLGVTCQTPPPSRCFDSHTLITHYTSGVCDEGACLYSETRVTCDGQCTDGRCTPDECTGVICNAPPASRCLSSTVLRTHAAPGQCGPQGCSYAPVDVSCSNGCADGACLDDPCRGVSCQSPPASSCVNATTLRTFGTSGTCAEGSCLYVAALSTCANGCGDGACLGDPCQGVTCNVPPASSCIDVSTLRTFASTGTCAGGGCSYAPRTETCPHGCLNGACLGDPCMGVTCNGPPASSCLDATTLQTFGALGTCGGNGVCAYPPSQQSCANGCRDGACLGDPCAGVSCTVPPAATCVDANTLKTFAPSGTCSNGSCVYAPTQTPCPHGCANGACVVVTDPCQGVSCTAQQPAVCVSALTLRTFAPTGTCSAGSCSYPPTDTACAASETCGSATCQWNDPRLASLTISVGTLTFSPNTQLYPVVVPSGTSSVSLTFGVPTGARGTVKVNGTVTTAGAATPIALGPTGASATIRVDAESGATLTYTVVFTKTSASPLAQQAYVKSSGNGTNNRFGSSIALSADGNTLAVGAEDDDGWGNILFYSGSVYVFTRTGSTWTEQDVLAGSLSLGDHFGRSVSLSDDGLTLAVGATGDDSRATGINGDWTNDDANDSGAAYVFVRNGTSWSQQAYVKASNTNAGDSFGIQVSLSATGSTLAVGAQGESSRATSINGTQTDNSAANSGAVYVFVRSGTSWSQQAYVKASNCEAGDQFGYALALSDDGHTLAVGAWAEDGASTGVNGVQSNNQASNSGAVYVFVRTGTTWSQQVYLKASNAQTDDSFGTSLALSGSGDALAVGAPYEASNATGIDGNQADNSKPKSGAAYVFARTGLVWSQQSYVKASNTDAEDRFGREVALSNDGATLLIGSLEDSNAVGIDGDQSDNTGTSSGAVYLFARGGQNWAQTHFVKASNSEAEDHFAWSIASNADGTTLVAGADTEDSNSAIVNGQQTNNNASNSGAAYVFTR